MARRRNAIFHRMSRLRGLPPDEKMLMQRIANLLDAALNNRQASNPFEPSRNDPDRVLYPPTDLVAHTGYRTLKLTWTAADSDQHLRYEIYVRDTETGVETFGSSFTNEYKFKGPNGDYVATVKSVGRDGSSSTVETVSFTLGGNFMQIEGSKNGPTTLGTIVQDHITVYDGYSVYAWGSVVLDKFIAGSSNSEAVMRLYSMEGANQTFDANTATLVQTIVLYPASESFSNLDSTAHGSLITRPTASRPGTFDTSQSVMFSPIRISTTEDDVTYTFFLKALNREIEVDEVNLSLVLWGGFDGLGDNVPQDPWDGGRADYVFPHLHSLRIQREETDVGSGDVTDGRWFLATQPKQYSLIDNAWTLALWVRLETEHVEPMVSDIYPYSKIAAENTVFRRSSFKAPGDAPYNFNHNFIEVTLEATYDPTLPPTPSQYRHNLEVRVGDDDGSTIRAGIWYNPTFVQDSVSDDDSYLWPLDETLAVNDYGWQFIVICFEGGDTTTSLTPKLRVYANCRGVDSVFDLDKDQRYRAANAMESLNQRFADGAAWDTTQTNASLLLQAINNNNDYDYLFSIGPTGSPLGFFNNGAYRGSNHITNNGTFMIHQAGMWNVAIDNWDGMGFQPGVAEQRDSSPVYQLPWIGGAGQPMNVSSGRENTIRGTTLTALHYLYNQGYATDIDWKKNSMERPDGAREYIFAENLIHLWQFGAVAEEFAVGSEALRDTGNYLYGGDINFLSTITTGLFTGAASTRAWSDQASLADIVSPTRWQNNTPLHFVPTDPAFNSTWFDRSPPHLWKDETSEVGVPTGTGQTGIVWPAGSVNGAGYSCAGTTADHRAYPGLGMVMAESTGNSSYLNGNIGWRRPNTTYTTGGVTRTDSDGESRLYPQPTGVLVEPKTWGPIFTSFLGSGSGAGLTGLDQAEIDTGQVAWP